MCNLCRFWSFCCRSCLLGFVGGAYSFVRTIQAVCFTITFIFFVYTSAIIARERILWTPVKRKILMYLFYIQVTYKSRSAYWNNLHKVDVSSEPSLQSLTPSHMDVLSMHWSELQVYSPKLRNK